MFELTINGVVYQFTFGMGFMREVNKGIKTNVDGTGGVKKNVGLQYCIAGILDYEVETLIETLVIANKGQNNRITAEILDSYIDNPDTDIDKLFKDVIGFLETTNATKKTVDRIREAIEEQKKKNQN